MSKVHNWHYLTQPWFVWGLGTAILFNGRRRLSDDARRLHERLLHTHYEGLEHIPPVAPSASSSTITPTRPTTSPGPSSPSRTASPAAATPP